MASNEVLVFTASEGSVLHTDSEFYTATKLVTADPPREETPSKGISRMNCCVPRCPIWGYPLINGIKVKYHMFPKDEKLLKEWLVKTRVDVGKTFKLSKVARKTVCSLHFREDDYMLSAYCRPRLKKDAVPSVFNCWENIKHLNQPKQGRKPNRLQQIPKSCPSVSQAVATPEASNECVIGEPEQETIVDIRPPGSATWVYASRIASVSEKSDNSDTNNLLTYAAIKLENLELTEQIKELQMKIKLREDQLLNGKETIQKLKFSVENLSDDEIQFYTGFPSLEVFNIVLELLNPGNNGENVIMKQSIGSDVCASGRKRHLSTQEQFLLVMCRLRLGLFERDLATRFGIGKSSASHLITSWINFMYVRLGSLCIWPSRAKVDRFMPHSFKEKYPSTRVIIDATELKVEMPSSLLLKSQSYSNYKGTNTAKGLVGITPGGSVCFLSQLYTGCISDKDITERSGFLNLPFEHGDSIMADKGFDNIRPLLPPGVSLNIPPFLGRIGQMDHNDVLQTQSIAAERIHVERAIKKIKEFHIFDQIIPLSLLGILNQMWTVCGLLTLFQNPIISQ